MRPRMWKQQVGSQRTSRQGDEDSGLHLLPRAEILQQACEASKILGSGHFSAVWAVQVNGAKFAMKVRSVSTFHLFGFPEGSPVLDCAGAYSYVVCCLLADLSISTSLGWSVSRRSCSTSGLAHTYMSAMGCAAQMTLVDHEDEDRGWLMRSLARERYFSLACGGPNVVPIVAAVTAPLFGEGDAHDALASVCQQHTGSSSQPHDPTEGNVTGQAYFFFMPLAEYGMSR